jgi:hypothetical protein
MLNDVVLNVVMQSFMATKTLFPQLKISTGRNKVFNTVPVFLQSLQLQKRACDSAFIS